jgi:peptide deformylase
LQHEIDHLDGILFVDRLISPEKLIRLEPFAEEEPREELLVLA